MKNARLKSLEKGSRGFLPQTPVLLQQTGYNDPQRKTCRVERLAVFYYRREGSRDKEVDCPVFYYRREGNRDREVDCPVLRSSTAVVNQQPAPRELARWC